MRQPPTPRRIPWIPIAAIACGLAFTISFFIWSPKRPVDPLGIAVLMATDYAEQLNAQGIEASLVWCAPIRGDANRHNTYACSFKIDGELRRIDCNIDMSAEEIDGGCYPAQ